MSISAALRKEDVRIPLRDLVFTEVNGDTYKMIINRRYNYRGGIYNLADLENFARLGYTIGLETSIKTTRRSLNI